MSQFDDLLDLDIPNHPESFEIRFIGGPYDGKVLDSDCPRSSRQVAECYWVATAGGLVGRRYMEMSIGFKNAWYVVTSNTVESGKTVVRLDFEKQV